MHDHHGDWKEAQSGFSKQKGLTPERDRDKTGVLYCNLNPFSAAYLGPDKGAVMFFHAVFLLGHYSSDIKSLQGVVDWGLDDFSAVRDLVGTTV